MAGNAQASDIHTIYAKGAPMKRILRVDHFVEGFIPVLIALLVANCGGKKAETQPSESQAAPQTSGEGQSSEEVAVIETRLGSMTLEFFPDVAPNHVANFIKLAKAGFYNGTTFHRVIPGFMIQGGDPNSKDADRSNDGTGGPGYTIDAEFNQRPHLRGTLSMARAMDPNSAGSQFFICVTDVPHLNGNYTVFGQVIRGIETVDKIVNEPRDARDNPLEPVPMTVKIIPRSELK
jgi:peptidyl-prolyl cis-trans isomerase B (cyclophilin B)